MVENEDALVKMILESCGEQKKDNLGVMGRALFNIAHAPKEVEAEDIDKELIEKMEKLKEAEENGDLAWMSYSSWNVLPPAFKNTVEKLIDPLFWSGIYFEHSEFRKHQSAILQNLEECSLHLTNNGYVKQYHCYDVKGKSINMMSEFDFNDLSKRVRKILVESYACINGNIVLKRCEREDD